MSNPNLAFANWIIDSIQGDHQTPLAGVVVSPGSRSTPFVVAIAQKNTIPCEVVLDERSAAFMALGWAKSTGKRVVLICTSGTALAHYYPALIEAALTGVSLMVVSADRPGYLAGLAAAQTIQQANVYSGNYAHFLQAPLFYTPDPDVQTLMGFRAQFTQLLSRGNRFPIHLNVPFTEPLITDINVVVASDKLESVPPVLVSPVVRPQRLSNRFVEMGERPYIIFGPDAGLYWSNTKKQQVLDLLHSKNISHHIDIASGLSRVVDISCDLQLKQQPFIPELATASHIVYIGRLPTSKQLWLYTQSLNLIPKTWVIEDQRQHDPDGSVYDTYYGDSVELLQGVTSDNNNNNSYQQQPISPPDVSASAHLSWAQSLKQSSNQAWVLASSMSIRYVDTWCTQTTGEIYTMRGANGIDGTIAFGIGVALGTGKPTKVILGDLATQHDIGSLAILKTLESSVSLELVILNNNGGDIFSHLPVAQQVTSNLFNRFFKTPQHVDFKAVVAAFGLDHHPGFKLTELIDTQHIPSIYQTLKSPVADVIEVTGFGLEPKGMGDWSVYAPDAMPQLIRANTWIGYSMGGRVLLESLKHTSHLPQKLILISTSPGLDDSSQREIRRQQDQNWLNQLHDDNPLDAFFAQWDAQPLFKVPGMPVKHLTDKFRIQRQLESLSPGVYPHHWDWITQIPQDIQVYWLTGALDTKYKDIAQEVSLLRPDWHFIEIPKMGHRLTTAATEKVRSLL
jgi:2-succinyl-5-enolpyruvyl-6-hydroxy-3-cyclohexene-1-carboxylate synthase